jgi:outer membrane protein TolC
VCCVVGLAPAAWADPITFAQAIARAGADGPSIAARKAAADAARLSIGPAGQLPDPQVSLGLNNVPITGMDRYRLNRDEMTMFSIGIEQDVPNVALRRARSNLAAAETGAAGVAIEISRLEARLAAGTAWIDAYFAQARTSELEAMAEDLHSLSATSTASLASGAGAADAVLAARLAEAGVADRLSDAKFAAAAARAELARWIGPIGDDPIGPAMPGLEVDPASLREHVEHHVGVTGSSAALERARASVEVARAGTQPDWSWSLMYGRRDPSFGDMVSLGLKFSLPLFQSSRQSPTIDARRADVSRATAEREAVLREHRAMLEARLAEHAALSERLSRARDMVLPLSRQREAVAAGAHASGTGSLAEVITARREVREAALARIDVEHRLALVDTYLMLEYGDVVQ